MNFSAAAIVRGVEANLLREYRRPPKNSRRMGHNRAGRRRHRDMHRRRGPADPATLNTRLQELFADSVQDRDVYLIGLYRTDKTLLLGKVTAQQEALNQQEEKAALSALNFPPQLWKGLAEKGIWSGMHSIPGRSEKIFLFARRTLPLSFPAAVFPAPGRIKPAQTPSAPPAFVLLVGITPATHLQQFAESRRTAILQGIYAGCMAVFLGGLCLAFIRRRDQGRALMQLEYFHSILLDTMPDGLLTLDSAGRITAGNPAARTLLLRPEHNTPDQLIGTCWQDLPFIPLTPQVSPFSPPSQLSRTSQSDEWRQYSMHERLLEIRMLPIKDHSPAQKQHQTATQAAQLVLIRDRTELRSLENKLNEANKLAAIGRLTAGMAHEIRNPLAALRGFAQFFAQKLKGQQPHQQYADTMVTEADRLDKVITDMLFLSRPREPEHSRVDMAALTQDLNNLLAMEFRQSGISFVTDITCPWLDADPDMLRQALLNLLLNSLAALFADEKNSPSPARHAAVTLHCYPARSPAGGVCISVTDTGPGMTQEEKEHALEPFYTSKKQGTGLGLAIVHRIMQSHGGSISISSPIDKTQQGTRVELFFPAASPRTGEKKE